MYHIEDLFDKRSVVGTRLEQILANRACTKAKLCKGTGVSRPTLDKLLAGTLTSKTNFEKHLSKVLDYLAITPDTLMGTVCNEYNRTRTIRNILRISAEAISEETGLPMSRLKEIEAGEEATTAELRDIALCLGTSVNSLQGNDYFDTQVAQIEDVLRVYGEDAEDAEELNGFWGHIGILPKGTDQYLWYPITAHTRESVYQTMDQQRIAVPCMNNKILLVNMQNIKEIVFLDDACDQPGFTNWDNTIDCGEIPLVIYEALEDYVIYQDIPNDILSPKFHRLLDAYLHENQWDENMIWEMIHMCEIHFNDGESKCINVDFNEYETISSEIFAAYNMEDVGMEDVLYYRDFNGMESATNIRNLSVLVAPLLEIENAIHKIFEGLIDETALI